MHPGSQPRPPRPREPSPPHPNLKPRIATKYLRDASNYFPCPDRQTPALAPRTFPRSRPPHRKPSRQGWQVRYPAPDDSCRIGSIVPKKNNRAPRPFCPGPGQGHGFSRAEKDAPRSGFHAHARAPGFSRRAFRKLRKTGILQIGCERAISSGMAGQVARDRPGAFCPATSLGSIQKPIRIPPRGMRAPLPASPALPSLRYQIRLSCFIPDDGAQAGLYGNDRAYLYSAFGRPDPAIPILSIDNKGRQGLQRNSPTLPTMPR